jgi:Rrf2 family protein
MGPNGGYSLRINPSKISLLKIIEAVQGPVRLNRCLFNPKSCPLKKKCPVSKELKKLQNNINNHLKKLTLNDLIKKKSK